jgi:hypothetical protein
MTAAIAAMYSQYSWPTLTAAIQTAMKSGDGTALLTLADAYYERDNATGAFQTNMFEAFMAISCLDKPVDARRSALDAEAAALVEASPVFGPYSRYGAIGCAEWPFPARGAPTTITAPGADPILVVGTTGDPATPYGNAVTLADSLDSGVLLTYEGEGHTAVGQGSACIADAVSAYLIDGTVPAPDTRCT